MPTTFDDQILREANRLEPIPASVLRVLAAAGDPDASAADIGRTVSMDQALFGRVLADANSAARGATTPIGSANSAVAYIGPARVIHLALLAVTGAAMSRSVEMYRLECGEMSVHAQLTATACEVVRAESGMPLTLEVVACGLLHDIGKIVMSKVAGAAEVEEFRRATDEGVPCQEAERELFDLDHSDVSHVIATGWGLPAVIGDALRHHHRPEEGGGLMAHAVAVADGVAHSVVDEATAASIADGRLGPSMAALKIDADRLDRMLARTEKIWRRRTADD